jgi:hypothetical protein
MKTMAVILGVAALGTGLGVTGCGGSAAVPAAGASTPGGATGAAPLPSSSGPQPGSSAPGATKTVIQTVNAAPPSTAPAAPPQEAAGGTPAQPSGGGNVTDPWAVVSAYYGDIESGNYAQAFALIGNGAVTGQSYAQFVAGFRCTGSQVLSENWESGNQVNFDLAAVDSCAGGTDYYTITDTVENGAIVAADVTKH